MKRSVRNLLVLVFLLTFGSADFTRALSAQSGLAKAQIKVRLYNYAEAPIETLQQARAVASGVFNKIGVGVQWLDCYIPDSRQQLDPACSEATTPATLQLRIATRSTNTQISGFGIALPALDGGFSKHATVFYGRVEELVRLADSTRVAVLGHIMAHEIGHLLLGPGSHSSGGIMRFPWKKGEVQLADKGWLRFTSQQAEQIQAQVRTRIRAEVAERPNELPVVRLPDITQPHVKFLNYR